ncbi:MAG: ATP-binding protein [Lachnospiraceae bacterium]|nr:ATP-binding protein [Lachnospiraceae bacterium]
MIFDKLNLIEMVLIYDNSGRILDANKQALLELGYPESLEGLLINDIFVSEIGCDTQIHELKEAREITGFVAYRRNRTCFPVYLRILPAAGLIDSAFLTEPAADNGENYILALNMLAQSNLEKEILALKIEAEEFQQNRNEFIANVTHELRTPVNGIRGHITAMLHGSTNAHDRKTYSIIQKCCEDMTAIISNILDFSKLEAGRFELENEVFDLYELLNHIVATHLAVVNEKGIRIILNIADNVPRELYGDGLRLGQILNNLVSNAVKFTDIGYVSIDVNKHGQYGDEIDLFILVRDTGIGIPPEQMDKLFKSFSQVDGSSTRKYGGTGLGLMIARELVGLMEGRIQVESAPDKGSSFSFNVHLKTPGFVDEVKTNDEISFSQPGEINVVDLNLYENILQNLTLDNHRDIDSVFLFGTPDNIGEVRKKCNILILAMELEAWEKAETISDNLKKLLREAPDDIRKLIFRLGMAIRKEDEKSHLFYEKLLERLDEEYAK